MIINVDVKINDKDRLKKAGERVARAICESDFHGDIEMVGLLQALLGATGANVPEIYREVNHIPI